MPITRWNVELPTADELAAPPRGVVVHWTGGGNRANAVDLAAYHYVVEADGKVVAGNWPVRANLRQLNDDKYARHTGGYNSFRVGLSCAGMKDYRSPSSTGTFPLKEIQVRRMMEVAAYFVELGNLNPLNPAHLCTHQEVWTLHRVKGTTNHTKTDIEFLSFRMDLKAKEVGDYLRQLAADAMKPSLDSTMTLPEPLVLLDTRELEPSIAIPTPPPLELPVTTPVQARDENRSLWYRVVGRFFG